MMISFWERKNHGNDFLRTPKRGRSGEERWGDSESLCDFIKNHKVTEKFI